MANASDLSLRGGQRPTWRPEREARGSALGVQSREGSHVDRTRHCRGADSRARRRTYSPYKPPSKWQTLPICHCEEANGRRGALSAKREEVPLGCNLGKAVTLIAPAIVGERTAGPGGALTVRTSHRQNGKRFRLVIARSEATWQSRRTEPDPRKTIGEIVTAFPRLPRARSALAMTNLRTLHR